MPIPLETFPPLEDTLNRLAAESVIAQIGRDEGLIPAYSLLGELTELAGAEPRLLAPLQIMRAQLEQRLDRCICKLFKHNSYIQGKRIQNYFKKVEPLSGFCTIFYFILPAFHAGLFIV